MIKKCIFINTSQKGFERSIEGFDRVYFGAEFCENMLPSKAVLNKVYRLCGKKLTWVIPITSLKGIGELKKIIPYLESCEEIEVVFNDWGVFQLLKSFKNVIKIQGRVLTRQIKDPNLFYLISNAYKKSGSKIAAFMKDYAKIDEIPEEAFGYYREIAENGVYLQSFLKDCGIGRVELDYLKCGLHLTFPEWLKATVYFPEVCFTVSRNCQFKNGYSGDCDLSCLKSKIMLKSKIPRFPSVFLKGNRLCYSISKDEKSFLNAVRDNPAIDRIVINQGLNSYDWKI